MKRISLKLLIMLFALLFSASVVMTSCDIDISSQSDERSKKEESSEDEKDVDDEDEKDVDEKKEDKEDVKAIIDDEKNVENDTASSNVNNNKINKRLKKDGAIKLEIIIKINNWGKEDQISKKRPTNRSTFPPK